MIQKILTVLLNTFQETDVPIVPKQIGLKNQDSSSSNFMLQFQYNLDVLAAPDYPSEAVSHWGLIIFSERALLHNPSTTSEIQQEKIALLVAKELAEQVEVMFKSTISTTYVLIS